MRSTTSNDYNCIDPAIVEDASGQLWMSFGSFWSGIKLVKLDNSTMKPSSSSVYSLAYSSEIEASYIVYKDSYYYLFVSLGKCCAGTSSTYKIAYGRSKSITGPYLDKNNKDMLSSGGTVLDSSSGQWIGPGGQSVAKNGSNYLMVAHAYDANKSGEATLRIKDLYFDSNGWPTYTASTVTSAATATSVVTATSQTSSSATATPTTSAVTGTYIHNFTTSGKTSSFYTITGNLSTSKGTVTYNGLTLTQCLKIESSTSVKFTTTKAMSLTLVFNSANSTNIKVDGTTYTLTNGILTLNLAAGSHTITKAGTGNLYYMSLN
jgi:beta-xylosidase